MGVAAGDLTYDVNDFGADGGCVTLTGVVAGVVIGAATGIADSPGIEIGVAMGVIGL